MEPHLLLEGRHRLPPPARHDFEARIWPIIGVVRRSVQGRLAHTLKLAQVSS